ncbi:hypothetical protein ACVI1I_002512 [Bradyrhizobium sp. USDA 4459]
MHALTRMHAIPPASIAVDQEPHRYTGLLDTRHFFLW